MNLFKKLNFIYGIVALLLISSMQVNAAPPTWTNGLQKVKSVIWAPDGYKGFYVEPSTYHDPFSVKCEASKNLYVVDSSLGIDEVAFLHSLIMEAHKSGKSLYVYVSGCDVSTKVPKFSGLQLN